MKLKATTLMQIKLLNNLYLEATEHWLKHSNDFGMVLQALHKLEYIKTKTNELYQNEMSALQQYYNEQPTRSKLPRLFFNLTKKQVANSLSNTINHEVYDLSQSSDHISKLSLSSNIEALYVSSQKNLYIIRFIHGYDPIEKFK